MEQRNIVPHITAVLVLCLCVLPAAAVIQEVTLKGPVATLSPQTNTLTIEFPQQYGCSFVAAAPEVCSYIPMNGSALTGTVPDAAAFSVFKNGDQLIATSLGGAGGTWITLAKLYGARPNEEYVTDIVGDPSTVPAPLIGNYSLDITASPDCSACTGTVCAARSSDVTVKSGGKVMLAKVLLPGESLVYNGSNDGSSVAVTFVKGEAPSEGCPGMTPMTGTQPVPVFLVKVVPPASFVQKDIRTATTTRPDEALTALPVGTAGTAPVTSPPVPATRAGPLPFAVIGALGVMVLIFAAGKR